jgi:RHS repeat-associated protein
MGLDYYNGDYQRSGTNISSTAPNNRYNGLITGARDQISEQTITGQPLAINQQWAWYYKYDYQNRLLSAHSGKFIADPGSNAGTYNITGEYKERGLTYDANGNIINLRRYAYGQTAAFDSLTYNYSSGSNRLGSINDFGSTFVSGEITNQQANNYSYNSIGQLTGNVADGQFFSYNAAGLVTAVYNNATDRDANTIANAKALYTYDDAGFRIKKYVKSQDHTTWYIRDASGNLLSTYEYDASAVPSQTEAPIYGSSRIGEANISSGAVDYTYELTDHLGNVRTTIGLDAGNNLSVLSYADYYPFGWEMPGRNLVGSKAYRFGYQGQFAEKDPETGLDQFEARLLDTRIGRWLTYDPAGQYWSPYISMGNNPVSGMDPDGCLNIFSEFFNWISGNSYINQAYRDNENPLILTVTNDGPVYYNPESNKFFGPQGYFGAESTGDNSTPYKLGSDLGYNAVSLVDSKMVDGTSIDIFHGENKVIGGAGGLEFLAGPVGGFSSGTLLESEMLRIENAATRINKPIHLVGGRAAGKITGDWDYIIEGGLKNSREWSKIKNSLPGAKSVLDNTPRDIDIIREALNPNLPHVTFYPRH